MNQPSSDLPSDNTDWKAIEASSNEHAQELEQRVKALEAEVEVLSESCCGLQNERDSLKSTCGELNVECQNHVEHIAQYKSALHECADDKTRMDWLCNRPGLLYYGGKEAQHEDLRKLIDEDIKSYNPTLKQVMKERKKV